MPAASATSSRTRQASAGAWRTPAFDWPTLVANKDAEIARLEGLYRTGLERAGVTILQARAELVDPHTVIVQPGGRKITARDHPGGDRRTPACPTCRAPGTPSPPTRRSTSSSLPKSIVIVGGGYIAVEFAGIFAGLGVETTLLYRREKILRGFDEELRDNLTQELFKRGIDVRVQRRDRLDREGAVALQGDAQGRRHHRHRPRSCSPRAAAPTPRASASRRRASSSARRARSSSMPTRAPPSSTSMRSAT